MKRDPLVIGKNYILPGDDVGIRRPNANALIVGTSGCGKSTSVILPTLARLSYSNPVLNYAKERDAYQTAAYVGTLGYNTYVLNLINPAKSSIAYDPVLTLRSNHDVESLASAILASTITKTNDDYWQLKAKHLLVGLIDAVRKKIRGNTPSMVEVLNLFELLTPDSEYNNAPSEVTELFNKLNRREPGCLAFREYKAWFYLPSKTASCVRDTLAASLSAVFGEDLRHTMQSRVQFDAEKFVKGKNALIIISSSTDKSQVYFANLFYHGLIKEFLRIASESPSGELAREIRLIFDDFACSCKIDGFEDNISIFRAAGISAVLLLQSESQLEKIYGTDGAAIIRQNCAVYTYFPGGFDDRSCDIVSKRMNLPYEEILYAPLGKIFVMQSGRKPVHIPRYETLSSPEYKDYLAAKFPQGRPVERDLRSRLYGLKSAS